VQNYRIIKTSDASSFYSRNGTFGLRKTDEGEESEPMGEYEFQTKRCGLDWIEIP
jgi:hypothetical protein